MTALPALSPRMNGIQASPASILRRRARELRAAGRDIIDLSSGNLDFATPDHVIAAAHAAALRGETRYVDADGTPELKEAARAALWRTAITPQTRWLVINNPVNPSGTVYRREELADIADVLRRHPQVWVLADGLYEQIVFDGDCAPTLAGAEPDLKPRTLTVSGVAKTYAMMGWRVGYAAGPAALIREMVKIQSMTTSHASSISQAAAVAALNGPQDYLRDRVLVLRQKRDRLVALLNECPGLTCVAPQGTFYLLVSCTGTIGQRAADGCTIKTDRDLAAYLLESADVIGLPGEDFGMSPAIRVSFAVPFSTLEQAGQRLQHACEALS